MRVIHTLNRLHGQRRQRTSLFYRDCTESDRRCPWGDYRAAISAPVSL